MPPKQKYSKELIAETAVSIIEREGIEGLSHRSIANELNCSTQPVLSNFATMDDVRVAAREIIDRELTEFVTEGAFDDDNPMVKLGSRYIQYAQEHRNLLLYLVYDNRNKMRNKLQLEQLDVKRILSRIMKTTGLTKEGAAYLYRSMWFFSQGIAITKAMDVSMPFTLDDLEEYLYDVQDGFVCQLKMNIKTGVG